MHHRRMPTVLHVCLYTGIAAGLPATAAAQPLAEVGGSESADFVGPQNLPGRDKRTAPSESPEPKAQPAETEAAADGAPADAGS